MRLWKIGLLTAALTVVAASFVPAGEAITGKWKVVILAFGNDEFYIVDLAKKDGALTGSVAAAQSFLPDSKLTKAQLKDNTLELQFTSGGEPVAFVGPVGDGKDKIPGTIRFRGSLYPGALEKTGADKLSEESDQSLIRKILAAKGAENAKKRVEELDTIIHANKGVATLYHAYQALLGNAEKAGLSRDDVKKYADRWADEAKAHGPLWVTQCRANTLTALMGQPMYAQLALDLGLDIEKKLPADADLENKSELAKAVSWAAGVLGKTELAKEAEARHNGFETKLDEKYHKEVPPFAPQKFAGRKDGKRTGNVLFELFTGAQCPPCVAADVAFDALLKTYKGSELVTLQYHLHIPGPDPLTNEASLARAEYYGLRGTPSPFFNGRSEAGGGGGMAQSEAMYEAYRSVIDKMLEEDAPASIKLTAKQVGDTIVVNADAKSMKEGKLRLRIALTEESIRYVGGNKLRFHHHVVRDMPGGPEGAAFEKGTSSVQHKVNLAELRKSLNLYLDNFAKDEAFPRPRPDIQLQGLAVVAFVQDDDTKQVLHAVTVPVAGAEK